MPSLNFATLGVLCATAVLGFIGIMAEPPQQTCPSVSEIAPCACSVKKNGLDILCETTDISHINQAMTKLKTKNPIIFYLKLRHNNLPKLQGFVFLALDIRHLTIHNSSLAVIEETALSSLGKFYKILNFFFSKEFFSSTCIMMIQRRCIQRTCRSSKIVNNRHTHAVNINKKISNRFNSIHMMMVVNMRHIAWKSQWCTKIFHYHRFITKSWLCKWPVHSHSW